MPRGPRIDIPGLYHHVWFRGIRRQLIFLDDQDRRAFACMLDEVFEDAGIAVDEWALLGNHGHLSVFVGHCASLSRAMHRLLTKYSIYFARRHGVVGHILQNRYGSEPFTTDRSWFCVTRYVGLNVLEAGIVKSLDELRSYPWTGLGALMGDRPALRVHRVEHVLQQYCNSPESARQALLRWLADGISVDGSVVDLELDEPTSEASTHEEDAEERGGADALLHERAARQLRGWEQLEAQVAVVAEVPLELLRGGSRRPAVTRARRALAFLATSLLGMTGRQVAQRLGISPQAVSQGLAPGRMEAARLGLWPAAPRDSEAAE